MGCTVSFLLLFLLNKEREIGLKRGKGLMIGTDSLQYLPIADAVVITFLAPSVASYGCYLFLREPFPRSAQYASLISLIGVVLIARPTSFFSHSEAPSVPSNTTTTITEAAAYDASFPVPTSAQRLSAVAVAMVGVLGGAGALTSIRWIGNQAHPLISVNYFSVLCTFVSGLVLALSKPLHLSSTLGFVLPNGPRQWFLILFLGTCGFVMQYLLTKGLAVGGRGNSLRATNMLYTNMLFALALDKIVFGQSPGWWSLAGSGLILGSAIFVAVKKGQGESGARERDEEARTGGGGEEEMAMLGAEGDAMEEEEEGGAARREAGRAAGIEVELRDFTPQGPSPA
jgi:drug/metabolite transporter (DMT)-like permease